MGIQLHREPASKYFSVSRRAAGVSWQQKTREALDTGRDSRRQERRTGTQRHGRMTRQRHRRTSETNRDHQERDSETVSQKWLETDVLEHVWPGLEPTGGWGGH